MVVLTILTEKNGKTIYFEHSIPKVHSMKLISCSLFNSWDTLKKERSAELGDIESRQGVSNPAKTSDLFSLNRFCVLSSISQ